ncbi:MAG: GTPase ObgE [Planctomycetota bacterium]|jgi:GTP-binding protein|nr:GTPase ObgE [Planctomycetota bacterium]
MHDEVHISVRSGNGGAGCVSFRREKYVPEGGPDGGDGGNGADVVLQASRHFNTLTPYSRKRKWKAPSGQPGTSRNKSGLKGDDLVLEVPCGTIVRIAESEEILADLTEEGQRVVVAPGGRGGWGNFRFKKATNQVPRQSGPGEPGVTLQLKLELKLLADVGIIGFPNAGKSTLLSRMSSAKPKIGNYPFTTLDPQLGVVERADRTMVMADIPGLIEGAAEGVGLGHQFLRHVERCALLLHLVDASEGDAAELAERIRVLDSELERFSPELAAKPQLLVLNKLDVRPDLAELAQELTALTGRDIMAISGVTGANLRELENRLLEAVFPPE